MNEPNPYKSSKAPPRRRRAKLRSLETLVLRDAKFHRAFRSAAIQQAVILLVSALILDLGETFSRCLEAVRLFWLIVFPLAMLLLLRKKRWGYVLLRFGVWPIVILWNLLA